MKTDDELFFDGNCNEMPEFVMRSRRMQQRLDQFLNKFLAERAYSGSQEVLEHFSQSFANSV